MAVSNAGAVANKPSFAKVAAMAPPQQNAKTADSQTRRPDGPSGAVGGVPASHSPPLANATASVAKSDVEAQDGVGAITEGLDKINIAPEESYQGARSGSSPEAAPLAAGVHDDRSHLSNSSSKPASFDSKSMASENTFAMEEKESLRPDDSASVQATDEDESIFVPPASSRPENQLAPDGSNSSPRRTQYDGAVPVGHPARRLPMTTMINPPRFGEIVPNVPPTFPPVSSSGTVPVAEQHGAEQNGTEPVLREVPNAMPPDEKLIEAMGTPKDRLLLLQLEEKFLAFITHSKEITLDLPPQNAYERLLAHKLADYYNLNRFNSIDNSSIRLYKAAGLRSPVPLGELCRSGAGKDGLPTGSVAVKIMRRTALAGNKVPNDGSTAASSSAPSKTTSEAGAENTSDEGMPSPPEAPPSRDRSQWTREEREAHYKAARERIFRDFEEAPNCENSTADTSTDLSRSSSVTGKKKSHKQRTPRDDSFEARSSYIPGFPGMTYTPQNQHQHQHHGQHAGPIYQSPNGSRPTFSAATTPPAMNGGGFHSQYDPSAMAFPAGHFPNGYASQYGPGDQWSNSQSPQPGSYYNFGQQAGAGYGPYGSVMPSSAQQYAQVPSPAFSCPDPQWSQNQFQPSYQPHPMMQAPMGQNSAPMSWPNYVQQAKSPSPDGGYPFGAMVYQQFPASPPPPPLPHSQHPLPGSYNRPAFNPQIRSFVPTVSPMRYGAVPAGQGQPGSITSSPGGNNSGQSTVKPDPAMRNGSSLEKSQESLQKKWGTPAHLPKKPPPSQIPSTFEIENTPPLPSRQPFSPTCA